MPPVRKPVLPDVATARQKLTALTAATVPTTFPADANDKSISPADLAIMQIPDYVLSIAAVVLDLDRRVTALEGGK